MDTSHIYDRNLPPVKLLIGERELDSGSGGVFTHVNPATGQAQAEVPLAGRRETEDAVAEASKAFKSWRKTSPEVRCHLLNRLAQLIKENEGEFVRLAALEGGTPIAIGAGGPMMGEEWIKYYAGWADKIDGQVIRSYPSDELVYTVPEPYGVVGIIITWNGPLISLGMKVAPALAAGNTVVVKPAEQTPFVAGLFGELVKQAGFPPGVVNILPGSVDSATTLIGHPDVQKVSFTGGPHTASKILHQCADLLKPAVLELGGKSANIVFDDADLDSVVQQATFNSLGLLSGQGCELPTRLLVQDKIYDEMVDRVTATAKALTVGDPFDPHTIVGPLINSAACDRVLGMVKRAQQESAGRLMTGGERVKLEGDLANGYYIAPTVFADVTESSEIAKVEVFGPVLGIHRFSTEQEAIDLANATDYGLGGYIQTNDLKRAHRVAAELKTGFVHLNGSRNIPAWAPFGGVGLSGYGKEGGRPGLDEFIRLKTISLSR
jgi:aldehyde dehydrogenase (NAD+)